MGFKGVARTDSLSFPTFHFNKKVGGNTAAGGPSEAGEVGAKPGKLREVPGNLLIEPLVTSYAHM